LTRGGNLYASYLYAKQIERFAPDGTESLYATTSSNPHGMAFDGAGNLFVAFPYVNQIEEITTNRTSRVFINSGLDHPENLAFDSLGNLYIGCTDNNTIEKITPSGGESLFAGSGMNGPWFLAISPGLSVFATLAITQSGTNAVITWPTNQIGYTLQTTTVFPSMGEWTTATPTPSIANGRYAVTNVSTNPGQFYRLVR
jgi:hypothetical protein